MKPTHNADKEMITFMQHYLRIDTAQPNPDYQQAIALFKAQAKADGFAFQEIALPSGNTVAVITLPGSDPSLPALALNHHMDVVPAPNTTNWVVPPFSGEIHNNAIVGRGIQDMKGIGVVHYFALKALKDTNITPVRTIHLFAVPDEEIGGFTGTKEFVESDAFKQLNIGYIIDEGRASGDPKKLKIKVTERKTLQIRLTTTGSLDHGSRLQCHNAIHELIQMLYNITQHHKEQQNKTATTPAGLLLSTNITSLQAGIINQGKTALNVVPETATATIDIRVPPTMKIENVKQMIEENVSKFPNTTYQIEATVKERSYNPDYQNAFYQALSQTIEQHNLKSEQLYSEGTSDLRFYLERGIHGLGFTPFTTKDAIHGTNESVPIDDFVQGKKIITTFIKNFCVHVEERE